MKRTQSQKKPAEVELSAKIPPLPERKHTTRFPRNWARLAVFLFLLTRLYIWFTPPPHFSEIIYSYMPYAHLWASGVMPYRQQWYEYPPATIPLFYLPHIIDRETHGPAEQANLWHINYSRGYRGELLLVDVVTFALIWFASRTLFRTRQERALALTFYAIATMKATHFLYDTMDLTFASALALSCVAPLWERADKPLTISFSILARWVGYWLAAALKLVNLPLGILHALVEVKRWKLNLAGMLIAFVLVWGIPLLLFRSSLQVMLVYHQQRGVQVDSVPGLALRIATRITHTEKITEVYKNYEVAGPLTERVKPLVDLYFIGALGSYLIWSSWQIWQLRSKTANLSLAALHFTLGYVLVFLLSGKVQSTPFLIWLMPLIALYPWQNLRRQAWAVGLSLICIFVTMTQVPNTELGLFTLPILVGVIRTGALAGLLWMWAHSQSLLTHRENISST